MQKLNAKKLIEFKGLSERRKQTFANNLKKPVKLKEDQEGGGGDYWVSTTSAIGHAWQNNDNQIIEDKITELSAKLRNESRSTVRLQYQKNIEMLNLYSNYNFSMIRAKNLFNVRWVPKKTAPLLIRDLFVLALPNLVFNYNNEGKTEAGAIWFAAQKNGYRSSELNVFAELTYRYALSHFGKKSIVNPANCIVVDVKTGSIQRYSDALQLKSTSYVIPILKDLLIRA